ncbi:hypothetical protein Desaci_2576 [Desulfosporosinus acidiphilus SJ4]|uniref:Uncharacterized protein n=1 Tax=Desulfosporosinus acidiphilus (strain DSM 22704 / JCM 16185 / SJ4) TaxID=646529 RepID=I4D6T9_DESAJ|nr:hypothetical protein Desaci_2576 [Desulfosporosinus acidiphilus SJ4]
MMRKGGPSWAVTITHDVAMNFALYVGCCFGFISKSMYSGRVLLWHINSWVIILIVIFLDSGKVGGHS